MAQITFKEKAPSTHQTVGWVGTTVAQHKRENSTCQDHFNNGTSKGNLLF
jgi:hypothetical protein